MANKVPELTGQKVGEYEIVSKIGVGGMGAVYEGRQPLIGKRVAVKVLLPTLSGEQELVERFLAEARAVNEIRHRGIVDIFSFGQLPDGAHYFVMEFLQGEAFDRIIKKRAPVPLAEALAWTEETLDALDAAHQAGIIHRDIKPSNLFLVNTGRGRPYVKLLDFGIAKLGAVQGEATPQTRASVILGTPDYISPEQARGKPISPQTDLYAVGCVLFELVTGKRLFKSDNTLATMWSHVEDEPPLPSSLQADLPPALDELILWTLEKDPRSRPPSAGALRAALEQVRLSLGAGAAATPSPSHGAGELPVLGLTPPPLVRQRVMAGTPSPSSPGQPTLGTPPPRRGGQTSLRGPRGSSPPPTVRGKRLLEPPSGERTSESPPLSVELDMDFSETRPGTRETPARRARLPLVLAGLTGLLLVGVGAWLLAPSSSPGVVAPPPPTLPLQAPEVVVRPSPAPVEPTPPAVARDEPPRPEPVKAESPRPEPVKIESPKPDPVKPEVAKPKGPTAQQLQARLAKLEQKLAAREAQSGEPESVLRQLIDQARKDIGAAGTDAERRDVAAALTELEAQFNP